MDILNYENVIFEGGGVKGAAYARIPEILQEYGILKNIKKIAGSSAGSIAALMLALEYDPIEIKKTILNLDFNDFVDKELYTFTCVKIMTTLGINSGNHLVDWIKQLIMVKTGNSETTFAELHGMNGLELVITGTSLKTGITEYFSYKTHPTMKLWTAVRISITIPIFFAPIQYEGTYYLDGGILSNFPIWIFDGESYEYDPADSLDSETINQKTLGFKLISDDSKEVENETELSNFSLFPMIRLSVKLIMLLVNFIDEGYASYECWDRTVGIDVMDVKSTNFAIDRATVSTLSDNGYNQTKRFLDNKAKLFRYKKFREKEGMVFAKKPIRLKKRRASIPHNLMR